MIRGKLRLRLVTSPTRLRPVKLKLSVRIQAVLPPLAVIVSMRQGVTHLKATEVVQVVMNLMVVRQTVVKKLQTSI